MTDELTRGTPKEPLSLEEERKRLVELERLIGSSPTAMITPPLGDVPQRLACRRASPERSTPGPLLYHMPKTPSNFGSKKPIC